MSDVEVKLAVMRNEFEQELMKLRSELDKVKARVGSYDNKIRMLSVSLERRADRAVEDLLVDLGATIDDRLKVMVSEALNDAMNDTVDSMSDRDALKLADAVKGIISKKSVGDSNGE